MSVVREAEAMSDEPVRDAAWRFYLLLALFDRRDGSGIADLVQAAREGYERDEFEGDAWEDFDRLWDSMTSSERLDLVRADVSVSEAKEEPR